MTFRDQLPEDVKDFIIEGIACYDSTMTVAEGVREEFELVLHLQAIESFDPTKRAGWELSAEHEALIQRLRKEFLTSIEDNPIAHKAVRVRMLGRMAVKAEENGDFSVAAKLLEQVAKEIGGFYERRSPAGTEQTAKPNEPHFPPGWGDQRWEIAKRFARGPDQILKIEEAREIEKTRAGNVTGDRGEERSGN